MRAAVIFGPRGARYPSASSGKLIPTVLKPLST